MSSTRLIPALALALLLVAPAAEASFNWGGDCSSGVGEFVQFVPQGQALTVGDVPEGKANVLISLSAEDDVDIQLVDPATGVEIIAWPGGLLNGGSEECTVYDDVEYCYSGYNGDQTSAGLGNEFIQINGVTNRDLVMKAYGYQAGDADVEYSFETTPNCGEVGEGSFSQFIAQDGVTVVGTIAAQKVAVEVELNSAGGSDVDVQLIDPANGTEIVAWPNGLLNGATEGSVSYMGMTITYSGYNGIDGDWGNEIISIEGATTRELQMRAYGYQSGDADIEYEWGDGVGATCMGIATLSCAEGLFCKAMQIGVADPAGACHTELWCESDASAEGDCANVMHPMVPGFFGCQDYRCSWNSCTASGVDPDYSFVSTDPGQCAAIRFTCSPGESAFFNACGCGCKAG